MSPVVGGPPCESWFFVLFVWYTIGIMTAFFMTVWMAVGGFFGFYHAEVDDTHGYTEMQTVPTGNPGQSAPTEAVEACWDKQEADTCTFSYNASALEGICTTSGEELACTPRMPEM